MNKRAFGTEGESAARDYIVSKGGKILEMNFRRPSGEIDIIAKMRKTILFIEVKRRSSLRFGRPSEAVDPRKQAHDPFGHGIDIHRILSRKSMPAVIINSSASFDGIDLTDVAFIAGTTGNESMQLFFIHNETLLLGECPDVLRTD